MVLLAKKGVGVGGNSLDPPMMDALGSHFKKMPGAHQTLGAHARLLE